MNHFEVLGVPVDAVDEQITAAYRVRARQLHPDTKPDATPEERARMTEEMARLDEAWKVLRDPGSRSLYRARLEAGEIDGVDELDGVDRAPAEDERGPDP